MVARMSAHLDHLVVAADDLPSGVAWLEAKLGVSMRPGGEHAYFGTHNALLGLQGCYLEVIAIDPAAPAPAYPRWFGLDTPELRERLAAGPALIHWVVTVQNMAAALGNNAEDHGEALALSRGNNRWQLSVPTDGSLPLGGVLPSLIQWESVSPSARLGDSAIRLERLTLSTPDPARLQAALDTLGFTGTQIAIEKGPPHLEAALSIGGAGVVL